MTRRLRIASMVLAVAAVAVLTLPTFRDDAPTSLSAAGCVLLCLSVAARAARWRIQRRDLRARWARSSAAKPAP